MTENSRTRKPLSYRDAGVDVDAGNALVERIRPAVESTLRPEVLAGLGGFGGLFQLDAGRYREPVLVSGTDGVGTKLMLARRFNMHETIGIDLVAMCVNDILTCGAEPLFFLDYFATGALQPDLAAQVIAGIADGCRQAGCALIGGETAEMPGMYDGADYDLAGFAVGVVERQRLVDGTGIRAGFRILGLPSSGPHSNGYSLIREVLARSGADPQAPYSDTGQAGTLAQALMAPTRIYVRPVLDMLEACPVAGLAHITGGGLTENIVRVVPRELGIEINLTAWTPPEIFGWIQQQGQVSEAEMLRTFNQGIGMVLVVDPEAGGDVRRHLEAAGERVLEIGAITGDTVPGRVRYHHQ